MSTKVMKYEMQYVSGCQDFRHMQQLLWDLQRQTREIMNRTIQIAYHWDFLDGEHKRATGERLDVLKETGYKRLDGHVYNQLKGDYAAFSGANLNATIQKAWQKYTSSKREVLRGDMSIPSYKGDQPILVNKKGMKITSISASKWTVEFTLFSQELKKAEQVGNVIFEVKAHDNTQRTIMERVVSGAYSLSQCQIIYDRPKWFFYLSYGFEPEAAEVDPEKILGVDMGNAFAVFAASAGEYKSFDIPGKEAIAAIRQLEARRRDKQRQARYPGEGRIGHGTLKRTDAVYQERDRISNMQDTLNHRWSKALVDFAVQNGYGTIQMEDLSGVKKSELGNKYLRHWTYYALRQKIEYKAKEKGIVVQKVPPRFTSQRCSECGYISADNRQDQEHFICQACGFKLNADKNAALNLSIRNIDKIIEKQLKKQKCEAQADMDE